MGHREDLLAGAKRCLYERGYARTTARDIVAASGTNLASIGYHFGSKEALLNAAMMEALEEWGVEMEQALGSAVDPAASALERFEAAWQRIVETFKARRQLWVATVEVLTQAEHAPELRRFLADALQEGRLGLAALFGGIDPAADPRQAWLVGSLHQALLTGVLVQWMVDPERAPNGHDLAAALTAVVGSVGAAPRPGRSADEPAAEPG